MNGLASSNTNPSGVQGACPNGWHVPSDDEWKQLEIFLGMSQNQADSTNWRGTDEGGKLKETGTSHWTSPNTGATNQSGFTALPGGYMGNGGSSSSLGTIGSWWTATEAISSKAWKRNLHYDGTQVYRNNYYKDEGLSVRCVKN
jgi:uncharacterized protein (TIGR02145 family)